MGETNTAAQPSQEFEKVLADSSTDVASFDAHDKTLLQKLQHFLHSSPAAVPLIVLVLSLIAFGVILGGKFFSAFTMTLILQQVAIVGIVGAAQTLVILTAGIDLSVGAIMVLSSVIMGSSPSATASRRRSPSSAALGWGRFAATSTERSSRA